MVDCTGLENQQGETLRGFDSHTIRHSGPGRVVQASALQADYASSILAARSTRMGTGTVYAAHSSARMRNGGNSCGQRVTVRRSSDTLPVSILVESDMLKQGSVRSKLRLPMTRFMGGWGYGSKSLRAAGSPDKTQHGRTSHISESGRHGAGQVSKSSPTWFDSVRTRHFPLPLGSNPSLGFVVFFVGIFYFHQKNIQESQHLRYAILMLPGPPPRLPKQS